LGISATWQDVLHFLCAVGFATTSMRGDVVQLTYSMDESKTAWRGTLPHQKKHEVW
jgi:hypothetical protein